jgi:hypothetical protein
MSPSRPKYKRWPSCDSVERCSTPVVLTALPTLTGFDHGPGRNHENEM